MGPSHTDSPVCMLFATMKTDIIILSKVGSSILHTLHNLYDYFQCESGGKYNGLVIFHLAFNSWCRGILRDFTLKSRNKILLYTNSTFKWGVDYTSYLQTLKKYKVHNSFTEYSIPFKNV